MATVLLMFGLVVGSAMAVELTTPSAPMPLNDKGDTTVASNKSRKANAYCYTVPSVMRGVTKTNQNIGLDPEALANATPARNNVEGLVDEKSHYDGEELRNYTQQSADIYAIEISLKMTWSIADHVLLQPKIVGDKWGGGKIYFKVCP